MGMTATSMGIDFTFDELGKHFFATSLIPLHNIGGIQTAGIFLCTE